MGQVRTTRKGNVTSISYSGPFFTKDPAKTLAENMDEMLRAMAREGAEDVRAQIASHQGDMPYSTGWSLTRVMARYNHPWRHKRGWSIVWTSTEGLQGRAAPRGKTGQFVGNVAARTQAAMSTIEGRWHPFRMTKNRLGKARAINKAELLKGLQ